MFDVIIREAASRFGLGDKAATLVQTVVAYAINKDTGGISGLIQRFRDAGLGEIAQSWISGGTQAQAMSTDQSEVMFGQKGGLLDMVTSKLGMSREVVLPAIGYILPSVIGKLTPNGSIPSNLPDEVYNFIGQGTASNIAGKAQAATSANTNVSAGGSGMWKWLALLGAGVLAVLMLMKCGGAEKPELPAVEAPVEQVTGAIGNAAEATVDGAANVVEKTGEVVGDAAEATVDGAATVVGKTTEVVGDAADATVEGAANVVEKTSEMVGDAAQATADGAANVVEKTGDAVDAVAGAAAGAVDTAADAVNNMFVDTSNDVVTLITGDEKIQLAERDGVPVMKVFFDTGKHDVSAKFASVSDDVVKHMNENSGAKIVVQGFNDPTGNAAANEELSKNRAAAVRDALVALGIAADRIDLRKPNSTVPEGGSYDEMRRVEVTVID